MPIHLNKPYRFEVVFPQSFAYRGKSDQINKQTQKNKRTTKLIVNVHKLQSNTEGLKSALARLRHRTGSPSSPPSTSSPTPNTSSKSVAAAAVAAVLSSASDNRNVSSFLMYIRFSQFAEHCQHLWNDSCINIYDGFSGEKKIYLLFAKTM